MPEHILAVPFYPQVEPDVGRLASLGGRADLRALPVDPQLRHADALGLCRGAEACAAAAGRLRGGARRGCLAAPPSWFDLVARHPRRGARAAARIWRQEDYRANARAIMEALCGCPLGPLPEIADPTWTRSPSAAAIAAAEALPPDLPRAERLARVREIFAAAEPGEDRFRPFAPAERRGCAPLRGRPRAHRRVYPDMLMRFEPRELAA